MAQIRILLVLALATPAMLFATELNYRPCALEPPAPPREFRGAWIATVANLDWPSKPGLSVTEQKAELIALLDRAAQLRMNAVIFQVRPACDAMYVSAIEPWSEFLTGTMGKAPEPYYDPLAFAIAEAHKRGLELHAWFNPFRASLPPSQARSPVAFNHISRTHPEWVRRYGDLLWLDPSEPPARQHVLDVIMDVVRRYDVDGVTFDDYFYPYPEKNAAGISLEFPDETSWRKYGATTGMTHDEWRRANVNGFVQTVYHSIKAAKPRVKFGISPFGIWRPGFPRQIQGLDAYAKIYADSRLWLANGWLDYFSPQLYWSIDSPQQSFPVLLNWWSEQNVNHRHLWPSLSAVNVGTKWGPDEIAQQIQIVRREPGAGGEIFYHLKNALGNRALANIVRAEFSQPALAPASPWLDSIPPDRPKLTVGIENSGVRAHWETSGGELAWLWVLQFRMNGVWTTEVLPVSQTTRTFFDSRPDLIAVRAVDRIENLSQPAVLELATLSPARPNGRYPDLDWRRNSGQ